MFQLREGSKMKIQINKFSSHQPAKVFAILMAISFLLFIVSSAYGSGVSRFAKSARKEFKLQKYGKKTLKDNSFKAKVATIFTVLANTQELKIHQMNGATGNQVFIHQESGAELVFDEFGNKVEDCENKGSGNYYHPLKFPLGHFIADILPWLMLGNCREDSTTIEQRIEAYMADLADGLDQAVFSGEGFYLPGGFNFKGYGQDETVSFFLKAIETSNFNLDSFVPNNINDSKLKEDFIKALEYGFKEILLSSENK